MGHEGVVIDLAGGPAMLKAVQAAQSDSGGKRRARGNLRGALCARGDRESGIDGCAASRHRIVDVASHAANTDSEGIDECRH